MAVSKIPPGALKFSIALFVFAVLAVLYEINNTSFSLFQNPSLSSANINLTTNKNQTSQEYKVTRIVDGDTIEISYEGTPEKIRLIGINTPEIVDPRKPVECFGKEASSKMKSLASGENVRLEYDDSQSYRDIYGRLLAYVYIGDGEMLNRRMIADGYAYEYTYQKPYKYQKEFKEIQRLAEKEKRGLWADDACNIFQNKK